MSNGRPLSTVLATALAGWLMAFAGAPTRGDIQFQTIDNNADPTFNQLLGINNAGVIAGYFGSGTPPTTHPNRGYTITPPYSQANFTNENFPGSQQTQVTGLNNASPLVTVGFYADATGNNFGFVNQNGTFTSISDPNTPTSGLMTNQLLGINDQSLAAGFYVDGNGNSHGYVANLTNPGSATFTAINVSGATMVTASGINNGNLVSGFYTDAQGITRGFVQNLDGSGLRTFGFTGSMTTMFLGVNNGGLVVGSYIDAQDVTHGLLYNLVTGVATTIDVPGSVNQTVLNGLNDRGQIVGFYMDPAGNTHGVLVTVPEPTSLTLASAGMLGVLAWYRARRRRSSEA